MALAAATRLHVAGLTADAAEAASIGCFGGRWRGRDAMRAFWRAAPEAPWDWNWFDHHLPAVAASIGEDPATKLLLTLDDGRQVECVRIAMGREHFHLCASTQAGCRMACTFCETGKAGLSRNLTAAEICQQVAVYRARWGALPDHIVFMGMGEPLDNADELITALRVLGDSHGPAIRQERLTICTVGHLDGLAALHAAGFRRVNLTFSLHSAIPAVRERIVPAQKRWPLERVKEALIAYRPRANFRLGINYCLMPGINDSEHDAAAVADYTQGLGRCLVNVIPYNPGTIALMRSPTDEESLRFLGWLRSRGVAIRHRVTKGRDHMAACGQLGGRRLRLSTHTASSGDAHAGTATAQD
jgi:23S rRNA (adenine2503-C2)-methyltransferase